jgi:hypothetical protein
VRPASELTRRRISRSTLAYRHEIKELLEAILVGELLMPSDHLWLVSPWVSDIAVIDNTSGSYEPFNSEWGSRRIRLAELLAGLIRREGIVTLATRPIPESESFVDQVRNEIAIRGGDAMRFRIHRSEVLHEKGLLGNGFHLSGSMNFTMNGIELLEEAVVYETDPALIAEARLDFERRWAEE